MRRLLIGVGLLLVLAACTAPIPTPTPTPAPPLLIYADRAMANVLRDIRTTFLQAHPEIPVELVPEEPAALRARLAADDSAALVLTADGQTLAELQQQNRLVTTPRILVRDPLVVIVTSENPKGPDRIEDLNREGLKFAIAQETTPLGLLTRRLIENFRTDAAFGPDFPALLSANADTESADGAQVLERVLQKHADVGIAFSSEANVQRERVRELDITEGLNIANDYAVARLNAPADATRAQVFVDFLFSPQAQALWQDYGFEPSQ